MTQSTRVSATSHADEMPFGSSLRSDGRVEFKFWAPTAETVELCLLIDGQKQFYPMEKLSPKADGAAYHKAEGWYHLVKEVSVGTRYQYRINKDLLVPDPASRSQPDDAHGASVVVDPKSYKWRTASWSGRPWEETVLYELHVGTFTPEGTFKAAEKKLDYLKDLGVTAVELMPVADFPGKRGWGYDGVLLYAPDSAYGTPDDLRSLVDAAHEKGLMVFLDVVYNHFGPEGNYLHVYAKKFFNENHKTPWGAAINYDADGSAVVREFYIRNVLYWLSEFKFDGLRFDAVHAIKDDSKQHILQAIADAVKAGPGAERNIHLVLENDDNIADFLKREKGKPAAYTAQWNDDVHHAMHVTATGESAGYYADYVKETSARSGVAHLARCLTEGFAYQGDSSSMREGEKRGQPSKHLPPTAFVSFIQNHDQIGNRAFGDRIASIASEDANKAMAALFLLAPNIPMLYMGEEWGSTTPFFYFCDLGPDLAPLVTEGRRNEFAKFPEFQDPHKRELIPDPVNPDTFEKSKLQWSDLDQPQHKTVLAYHKELLAIRQQQIVPLISGISENNGTVLVQDDQILIASWNFGQKGKLMVAANLGSTETSSTGHSTEKNSTENSTEKDSSEKISNELKKFDGTKLIYETSAGTLPKLKNGHLPAWSVVWTLKND